MVKLGEAFQVRRNFQAPEPKFKSHPGVPPARLTGPPMDGFLSWPCFTWPHAPMTRHGASLSGPACSHLLGHVPFTRLTPRAHAVTIHA